MVTIDSGPVEATDKFNNTPKDKWRLLLIAKRSFLSRRLKHDCRCLTEFCEEAEAVYSELGFKSPEEMIREGYELEPAQVSLAVAWLKANGTEKPVGLGEIAPLAKHGEIGNGRKNESRVDNVRSTHYGNDTEYTLRRLKRDAPELLVQIESGELSVNAAAIKVGFRKKPNPEEVCIKAFRKSENRVMAIRSIVKELTGQERQLLIKMLSGEGD